MLIDVSSLSGESSKDNEGEGKGMGEGGEKEDSQGVLLFELMAYLGFDF